MCKGMGYSFAFLHLISGINRQILVMSFRQKYCKSFNKVYARITFRTVF